MVSFFVLCSTAGVPLSWGKTAGSDAVTCVGLVRASPQYVPPGDLSSEGRLVHQMDRRSLQGPHDQRRQFRRGTGQSDVRRKRPRARKTLPVAAPQLLVVASQRRCKNSANQREVLSLVLLTVGLTDEALQLCDGVKFMADNATGGRTSKRRSHRDRRLGTIT